jgi:hypothetical protein
MRISAWRIEMQEMPDAHVSHRPLTPAKAGVQGIYLPSVQFWIPAFRLRSSSYGGLEQPTRRSLVRRRVAGMSGEDVA